jgi:hypothetical protein
MQYSTCDVLIQTAISVAFDATDKLALSLCCPHPVCFEAHPNLTSISSKCGAKSMA